MRNCIISDIDGTLANNKHRVHHLAKSPKDWDAFNAGMAYDEPFPAVISVFRALCQYYEAPGILCTARKERFRAVTMRWLVQHGVDWDHLLMRRDDDFRKDAETKTELLALMTALGYRPVVVLDDRNSVVQMWRANGILCLQVADGDF